jgi:hypothetical protein
MTNQKTSASCKQMDKDLLRLKEPRQRPLSQVSQLSQLSLLLKPE